MIPDIFKDRALQEEFNEKGFVKISLLSESDIQKLTDLFHFFHPDLMKNSFGSSSFLSDRDQKYKIKDTLYPIFLPYFENLFQNFTYFGSSFLYKTKGDKSNLAPHQDWTIVDELKYVAINIWTPLIDTNESNGTLYVVPGSQSQKIFSLRAPTIPFYFQNYFDTVIKCSVPTNARAGEAVILNQSLIHYSTPNMVDDLRIAITSGLKTKGAPMLFHFKNEAGDIERFEMPEDFLFEFENFHESIYNRPLEGIPIGKITLDNFKMNKGNFTNTFYRKDKGIVDKFFELFR